MKELRKRLNNKGFTLVELLVVIAIIAILSATAFLTLGGETVKARDSRRIQDLGALQSALEIVFVNEGAYPADIYTGIDRKYLNPVPTDPNGDNYEYYKSGSYYLLAAPLENDGDPTNYTSYVIGNASSFPADTGVQGSGCDGAPSSCTIDADGGTNCLPYCP